MRIEAAVSRFLRHVAVERGLADNTLAAYRRDLGRYVEPLTAAGRIHIESVTTQDGAAFVALMRRDEGLAASSAARMLSTVRGLHRFLEEDGAVPADGAAEVAPPPPPRPPPPRPRRRSCRCACRRRSPSTRWPACSPPPRGTSRSACVTAP